MTSFLLTTLNAKYIHLNLAIRLLYQLNENHPGLSWKEFTIKEDPVKIAEECARFSVVAFSCYIWNIRQTLVVAKLIKEINPDVKILLGGPEVSYDWQELIRLPEIDWIITGEGEIPFQQFLKQYPEVSLVPNLIRKAGDEIHVQETSVTFDLREYQGQNPYRFDPVSDLYNKVTYIETSRGCPYKCEFCLASLDNKVRYLPMEQLKANLLYVMAHGRVIKFLDRTFNMKRDFTLEIFQFILEHHRPQNIFQFEITADILHPDIQQFILEKIPAGLFRFEIGIQTVNQKANLEVSRKQNFEKTKSIVQKLKSKVEMHLDLIVGLPLDYWEDVQVSFEEVFALFPPELQVGFLKFLKGTPVRYKAEQHGYVYDPNPPYQIIESKYLSKEQLSQIQVVENALEIYWNKKRASFLLRYIALTRSIFGFLLQAGLYFQERKSFHQHTLLDIFDLMNGFLEERYPKEPELRSLLTLDYCLQHKIKPDILLRFPDRSGWNYCLISRRKQEPAKRF